MSEVTLGTVGDRFREVHTVRGRFGQVLDFARSVEPRPSLSRRAITADIAIAAGVAVVVLATTRPGGSSLAAAIVTAGPLAVRRRFPLAAFFTLLVGVSAAAGHASRATFVAIVIAGYSAAMHSRYRGAALLSLGPAGVAVTYVFWNATARFPVGPLLAGRRSGLRPAPSAAPGVPGLPGVVFPAGSPWRVPAMLVLVSLVSISLVGIAVHVGDRIRRMQVGNEAATRRALELERARIASELHDVVTHSVSVMIVQAGAARQVLDGAPEEARAALLAVESSGRAAMTELRHLLGLLSPAPSDPDGNGSPAGNSADEDSLRPAPGLGELQALIDRVAAAGLPVDLQVGALPDGLPPGLDLAAYRIIQEALTNVLKHAGKTRTRVRIGLQDGDLSVRVVDAGPGFPAAGQPFPAAGSVVPGTGRGLIGLRERAALYGGALEAGPRPGGGWMVRARLPVDPLSAAAADRRLVAGQR